MGKPHTLIAIILLFLVLAAVYNVSLPLFEAPDEMAHFRYAHWIAANRRLPNMISDRDLVGHEIGQPPLYYALLAPLIARIDTHDFEHIAPPNPHWSQGGGISVHYHSSTESFPYRGTALAVHLARLVSTVIAIAVIGSTYAIARQIAPQFTNLAVALIAFNPQFIAISAAVSNDILVAALCSLALLMLIKMMYRPHIPWWLHFLVGALWGLAALTKLSGAAIGAIVCVSLLMTVHLHRSWTSLIIGGLFTTAGAVIVAGWWFGRNWALYGDPLAWAPLLAANRDLLRPETLDWANTLRYATFLQRSYWGVFGHGILAPASFYLFADALVALGITGMVVRIASSGKPRLAPSAWYSTILILIWLVLIFVLLLLWMQRLQFTNQGRLLFPAASCIAIVLAVGLAQLPRALKLNLVFPTMLACWAAAVPFVAIQPAYAQPQALAADEPIPNPVHVNFGHGIRLVGYSLPRSTVQAGEPLSVDLYWEATAPLKQSHVVALHVLGPPGNVVGKLDTIPYQGRHPTPAWSPGKPFRDTYSVEIGPDAAPGRGILLVKVYPWSSADHPLPVTVDGNPVGDTLTVAQFKLTSAQTHVLTPTIETEVTFDPVARLVGFDSPDEIMTEESFAVSLYWAVLSLIIEGLAICVHLLDRSGKLVAQADAPPQENWYPTSLWAPGERIYDPHGFDGLTLELATYRLAVGLYDPETGGRLSAYGIDGRRLEHDRAELATVKMIAR